MYYGRPPDLPEELLGLLEEDLVLELFELELDPLLGEEPRVEEFE